MAQNNFGMNQFNMNMNNINNINNPPFMNPLNNNFNSVIFMNNMNNQNMCNFPINSPRNFNNFGGNMNFINPMNSINPMMNPMNRFNPMMSPMNNFNNFNNMNNMPFQRFNSENIGQKLNINDLDTDIEINFRFVNSQIFKIKAKPREKLIDIINRFKNNECPKELKNSLSVCLCHADKVDQNKTLNELNIKNGEQILFMNTNTPEENKPKEKPKFEFTEREREQLRKFKLEYDKIYLVKDLKKLKIKDNNDSGNEADDEEEKPTFSQFCHSKDQQIGIEVNEHKHKLVYSLANIVWKCNICNIKYKKEVGKYYCSLCDYNMCEGCHYQKNYFMKKSFPKGTKPSHDSVPIHFLETPYHEHRLAFIRTSRHFTFYNGWICNNCRENFNNDKWSFYCTVCDFDLCCDCCGYH